MTLIEDEALPITLARPALAADFVAYPSRVSPRWILPVEGTLRRSGIRLYAPQKLGGHVRKQLLARGILRGEAVAVPEVSEYAQMFSGALGCEVRLAFLIGGRGPYQKVTARVMTPRGEVLAYAKIASRPLAVCSLDNERKVLEKLATVPALHRRAPRVLLWRCQSGTAALLLTAGPDKPGPQRFSTAHQDFLLVLGDAFSEQQEFSKTVMWRSMKRLYAELRPSLSSEWRDRYVRALTLLERELGGMTVSLTLAHRDFTPWNTRLSRDGLLFVFDWEWGSTGYIDSYDRLHFHFMRRVLMRHPRPFGALMHDLNLWRARIVPHLAFLAYLLDVSLFYHHMLIERSGNEEDSLLRDSRRWLDNIEAWLV